MTASHWAATREICRHTVGITPDQRHGGTVIDIVTPAVSATLALQGAQLLSWVPTGHDDVLWCSPLSALGGGKAIRGGIPLCWPWFGPHATEPSRPQHGYARVALWRLGQAYRHGDTVTLVLDLPAEAVPRQGHSGNMSARLTVTLGDHLGLSLETINHAVTPSAVTLALHTYFAVGAVDQVSIEGLDGATYRDNTAAGIETLQTEGMRIGGETIALFEHADAAQTLIDPVMKREIAIQRRGGTSTVVWNPGRSASALADIPAGAATRFICIESGAIGAAGVSIPGSGRHCLEVTYHVRRL